MVNYFDVLTIPYLESLLKSDKDYTVVLSRKDHYVELCLTDDTGLVINTIGNSIGHCLKRTDAYLRFFSESTTPLISEYFSTKLDSFIITTNFSVVISNIDTPVFIATLYNSENKQELSSIGFKLRHVLSNLEDLL